MEIYLHGREKFCFIYEIEENLFSTITASFETMYHFLVLNEKVKVWE